MRILLVGEYSGFHNALKYGLKSLGHEVNIVSTGDGFKKYPTDIDLNSNYFNESWLLQKLRSLFYRFFKKDIRDYYVLSRFRESEHLLKNCDVVQFINSNPFNTHSSTERKMIDFLISNNKSVTLVACGDDTPYADYLLTEHAEYSILDPFKKGQVNKAGMAFTMKYLKKGYRDNYELIKAKAKAIIPSNTDFYAPLVNDSKASKIIPAPVQTHNFKLNQNKDLSTIEIFMGINRPNYWKKGINYFEEALEIIEEKYGDRVRVTVAENLPYEQYIKSYDKAHILLDQVLCYDQGYNALEAMAQGKVVFAGASDLYREAHSISEIPVMDAQPEVDYLVRELSKLIDDPQKILAIGKKARQHILDYHNSIKVAEQYLKIYQSRAD